MIEVDSILPVKDAVSSVWFDGVAQGKLLLQRDAKTGKAQFYPRAHITGAPDREPEWFEASGQGTVYSYAVTHKAPGNWGAHAPYVIAYVELAEGPRVMTNIVDVDPAQIEVGMAVRAVFHAGKDGGAVLRFTAA